MKNVSSGGGMAAVWYTVKKAFEATGGPLSFARHMNSRNACKTCAVGMGGLEGGMRNETGHFPEFCKKSVQAMAADMQPAIPEDFFAEHTIEELATFSSRKLENAGRLAYPLVASAGDSHFRRISWDDAISRVVQRLTVTPPKRAFFYSSGRSSNEAAFLLQWLARVYGTNNVNNCSFYCHQASGVGLTEAIGTGTATVDLDDLEHADFVLLIGANPASNHPRLITHLVNVRARGGKVVVINPVRETGLERFNIPSRPGSLLFGSQVSDIYIQPRIGGDIALFKAILKEVIRLDALDREYIAAYTTGFGILEAELKNESLESLASAAGVAVADIRHISRLYAASKAAIFGWAMGITHHEHGVDNVLAIANLALARGMVGRPNAGLMPIRGHSNVQGVGSMGFAPELKAGFLAAMEDLYGKKLPDWKGMDSIESVQAASRGEVDFALFLGGNFYGANPNLVYAGKALSQIATGVYVSTKLNQGHVCVRHWGETIILPTLARDEEFQATTQESMFNYVRLSEGGMQPPAGGEMHSEVAIVSEIGAKLLPKDGPIDFSRLKNHDEIRKAMAAVVPGYTGVREITKSRKEFHVEGRVKHQPIFNLPGGKARFSAITTPFSDIPKGFLRLMTIRSEGQFNTVVYEEHDRYRNQSHRNVILMNEKDMAERGLTGGQKVTIRSEVGEMCDIYVAPYDISRGGAAMYYPEANALVPTRVDPKSGTPAFKNVLVEVLS